MVRAGYTLEVHCAGWDMLHAATGFDADFTASGGDERVRDAVHQIEAWHGPALQRCRAALERHHSDVARRLAPEADSETEDAVASVRAFLDALDALETAGKHPALETLASRGLTYEERARLRALCVAADRPSQPRSADPVRIAKAHEALGGWLHDWAETARLVMPREHLVGLGLAKKRPRPSRTETLERQRRAWQAASALPTLADLPFPKTEASGQQKARSS